MQTIPYVLLLCSISQGCALGKLAATRRSHPPLEGQVAAPGLDGAVTVTRDALGVPHIRAQSELDAWHALGFVHAQDRLFQLDLVRRLAFGDLSEWLGDDLVAYDAFVRGLETRRRSAAHLRTDPEPIREVLEAYAAGVNAGAASLTTLPIEYRLLGQPFEPYAPEDGLASVWVQSWNLAENPMMEAGALALRDLDPEVLDALFRQEEGMPPIDAFWDDLRKVDIGPYTPGFDAWDMVMGARPDASQASNNWVVGPSRSRDGKPIVANDPHLVQGVPSLWYVADVAGGDLHVAGATLPGSPLVIIGHNERVAWGLTNTMADYVDLAVLERDGDTGVIIEGASRPLRPVEVEVDTHSGPVTSTVWWSDVGPLITELTGTHVVALRWQALELDDQISSLLHQINRARSVEDALAAATLPAAVSQNLVVADVDGDYAWQVIGSMPVRPAHTGRVPYPASDPTYSWQRWRTDLPGERSPERGYLHTANARPAADAHHEISTHYSLGWRHQRIDERLAARSDHDPASMSDLQLDRRDNQAAALLGALIAGVEGRTPQAKTCLGILRDWNLLSDADAPGPAVWAVFQGALVEEMLVDDIGAEATAVVMEVSGQTRSVLSFGQERFLQDRVGSVEAAAARACDQLTERLGDDPSRWTWGALHPLALEHPFAARAPRLLRSWNMTPVPYPGSGATVAAAGHGWDPANMAVGGMASLRIVMPLSDLGSSTLVHPGGQSGQPHSMFYASHYGPFVGGNTLPLVFDDDDLAEHATFTLTLIP